MILCQSSENEDAEGNRTNQWTTERTNERTNRRKKLVGTSLHFARLAEVNAHKIYKRFNIFIFTLAHCTMPWHRERACGIQQNLLGWVSRRRLRCTSTFVNTMNSNNKSNIEHWPSDLILSRKNQTIRDTRKRKFRYVRLVREKSISRRWCPGVASASIN